jgi:hypothetical protein
LLDKGSSKGIRNGRREEGKKKKRMKEREG